jgi:hypothetical protein
VVAVMRYAVPVPVVVGDGGGGGTRDALEAATGRWTSRWQVNVLLRGG